MKKFLILGIFSVLVLLNMFLLFAFRKVNSINSDILVDETLDFSRDYDVKLDVDYLRDNIVPAHE
jgi:hypothetical protein